ncbi:hypothetical protein BH11ACT8_BH11ACT8_08000 [soil metagenome]
MPDRTPAQPPAAAPRIPPPLTVAAALVALEGVALVCLAVAEAAHVVGDRSAVGVSTAIFLGVYGAALVGAAYALARVQGWARGPVLLTQLIAIGLAWNVRATPAVALVLAVVAAITLAGMLHPASIAALLDDPTGSRDDPDAE